MQRLLPCTLLAAVLGCGTGTLALQLAKAFPTSNVTGLDADVKMLGRAKSKADAAGVRIQFDQGLSALDLGTV